MTQEVFKVSKTSARQNRSHRSSLYIIAGSRTEQYHTITNTQNKSGAPHRVELILSSIIAAISNHSPLLLEFCLPSSTPSSAGHSLLFASRLTARRTETPLIAVSANSAQRIMMLGVARVWIALLGWAILVVLVTEYRNVPLILDEDSLVARIPPSDDRLPANPSSQRNHNILSSRNETIPASTTKKMQYDHPQHRLPTVTIFYHLYIPNNNDTEGQRNSALAIIREQLDQLSNALASTPDLPPSILYYTSVGYPIDESYIQDICQQHGPFQACRRLQHLEEGFEEHTLQALFDHCKVHNEKEDDDAHHRVIYMHSKGSYHSSRAQNLWRRYMTDAVASRDCIEHAHHMNCDLCGLLYVPRPSHHFTGNMFNAKCRYIRTLIPPMDFEAKMDGVYQQAQEFVKQGILQAQMFVLKAPWNAGTQRYAMEHWHGSYPPSSSSIGKICDVSTYPTNQYWRKAAVRQPGDWQLAEFPRRSQPGMPEGLANDESKRKREYFLLPGQLMKWYQLYGEAPPSDSWVWSWYPDGAFWKEQVQKHGSKAVEMVASQWKDHRITT